MGDGDLAGVDVTHGKSLFLLRISILSFFLFFFFFWCVESGFLHATVSARCLRCEQIRIVFLRFCRG